MFLNPNSRLLQVLNHMAILQRVDVMKNDQTIQHRINYTGNSLLKITGGHANTATATLRFKKPAILDWERPDSKAYRYFIVSSYLQEELYFRKIKIKLLSIMIFHMTREHLNVLS